MANASAMRSPILRTRFSHKNEGRQYNLLSWGLNIKCWTNSISELRKAKIKYNNQTNSAATDFLISLCSCIRIKITNKGKYTVQSRHCNLSHYLQSYNFKFSATHVYQHWLWQFDSGHGNITEITHCPLSPCSHQMPISMRWSTSAFAQLLLIQSYFFYHGLVNNFIKLLHHVSCSLTCYQRLSLALSMFVCVFRQSPIPRPIVSPLHCCVCLPVLIWILFAFVYLLCLNSQIWLHLSIVVFYSSKLTHVSHVSWGDFLLQLTWIARGLPLK